MQQRVVQIICDGMGLSPESHGNALYNASTPTLDYLLNNYPSMRLLASGTEVGLDMGEPGNSEVGHLTIGTGQVLPQAYQIISSAIKSQAYTSNQAFLTAFEQAKQHKSRVHIVGLISGGGVHGHRDHITALLQLALEKGVESVAIHAITDGRDSPPKVAKEDWEKIEPTLKRFKSGLVGSISGRYYAMDRDNNWERTDAAYWALMGKADREAPSFAEAIDQAYGLGESDETIHPTVCTTHEGRPQAPIRDHDVVIFTNYRPDRIRQLVTRLITTSLNLTLVTMTDYFLGEVPTSPEKKNNILNAYPLPKPKGTLAEALAAHNKTQLHIAETEKYAHITYFYNGHMEEKQAREQWLLIPSVKIDSFARVPTMSAEAITKAYFQSEQHHPTDFTAMNYANIDMVGHTGDYEATCQAVTCVDTQLGIMVQEAEKKSLWLLITADHGNAEQMINPLSGEIDKEHTTNPVPLILIHPTLKKSRGMNKLQLANLSQVGILADIAPTILEIMHVSQPPEMVGTSVLSQLAR